MSRSGRDPRERLKTGKGRSQSSVRWLSRQLNDPYVKQAKAEGWRSRAAFKLIELDEKFGLLRSTKRVVDLGIAPGGWSQVVRKKAPQAAIVGIDLLPTEPIEGVTIFEMDFMADEAPAALEGALDGAPDLVLSDMAAAIPAPPAMARPSTSDRLCPASASRAVESAISPAPNSHATNSRLTTRPTA